MKLLFFYLSAVSTTVYAGAPYCTPGDECFPSETELADFNNSVDGRLIKTVPYGAACYKATYDAAECLALAQKKSNYSFRLSTPGALIYPNWEVDDQNRGCTIPNLPTDGTAPPATDAECTPGGLSTYSVNATSEDHISKAVQFAAKFNLRLRIKNTGHDYSGRSSGPGTFAIWTHYMNDATFIPDFQPCGEKTEVVAAGPGLNVGEVYAFGGKIGRTFAAGWSPSVGAAGGWVLGGGIGPFGNFYGMGVDTAVQFDIIDSAGQKKTANACTNKELFWAVRGGGGAFGVTTKVYFRAYPALKRVNVAAGTITCEDPSSYSNLIGEMVEQQVAIRAMNYSGLWSSSSPSGTKRTVAMVLTRPFVPSETGPLLSANETAEVFSSVLSVPGCTPSVQKAQFDDWNTAYVKAMLPLLEGGAPGGINVAGNSRLISYDRIGSESGVQSIKDFILNSHPESNFIWQNSVGTASASFPKESTSTHDDWRNTFAFLNLVVYGPYNGASEHQTAVAQELLNNATAVFGTASYYNENWKLENPWQNAFWGHKYEKLLEVKNAVDPKRVFSCRQCVGSEGGF